MAPRNIFEPKSPRDLYFPEQMFVKDSTTNSTHDG